VNGEYRGGFVYNLSMTKVAQESVTKIIILAIVKLITPKAGAKHELLFNKPISGAGLLNKCSCLAQALAVTKFKNVRDMILVLLSCCYLSPT
jgi:hypothetical protein